VDAMIPLHELSGVRTYISPDPYDLNTVPLYTKPPAPTLHERDEDGNWICCCGDSLPVSEAMERDSRAMEKLRREQGTVTCFQKRHDPKKWSFFHRESGVERRAADPADAILGEPTQDGAKSDETS